MTDDIEESLRKRSEAILHLDIEIPCNFSIYHHDWPQDNQAENRNSIGVFANSFF